MKKYLRIVIMDRIGICGTLKPREYVVNKKFCENWDIPFDGRSQSEIRQDLETACKRFGITLIEIR